MKPPIPTHRARRAVRLQDAVCGICQAKLLEGAVWMNNNGALGPEEVRAGYVLSFQSHPTSAKVTLGYDA